jgi:hypothetical protein
MLISLGSSRVSKIWGVILEPSGKTELMADDNGCDLGNNDGAAMANDAKNRRESLMIVMGFRIEIE